jgi:hypothetical protein
MMIALSWIVDVPEGPYITKELRIMPEAEPISRLWKR